MIKTQKVDKDLMKKNNLQLVLSYIHREKEISKAQIADRTKMSIMSISRLADELMRMGIIKEIDATESNAIGRPPKMLALQTDSLLFVGINLQVDSAHIGVVNPLGKIIAEAQFTFLPKKENAEEILKQLANHIRDFITGLPNLKVCPVIGIALPGIVDIEKGEVQFSSSFKWRALPLSTMMKSYLPQYDFVLENDIKAVAVAENRFGAMTHCANAVVLNLGEGIGAAVIIENEIYRGRDNLAGEIGHIIINPLGRMCECGQIGCLQTNIAEWAILREANSVSSGMTLDQLFQEYEAGVPWVVKLIQSVADYTGMAINLLANTYSPDVILLCGSMIREHPIFRELVQQNYKKQLNDYIKDSFELKIESFGIEGHIIGSAMIAFSHYLNQRIS